MTYFLLNGLADGIIGGSDKFLIEVFKRLNVQREVHVITSVLGRSLCVRNDLSSVSYHIIDREPAGKRLSTIRLVVKFIKRLGMASARLMALIDRGEDDVTVYASTMFPYDVVPAFLAKLKNRKVKLIIPFHVFVPELVRFAIPGLLKKVMYLLAYHLDLEITKRFADVVLTVNKSVASQLASAGVDPRKIMVVSNGVDTELLARIKPSEERFDACFLGRTHPGKGLLDLIKIWTLVVKRKEKAKLLVIGIEPQGAREKLLSLARQTGVNERNIRVEGFIYGPQKFALMKSSRILLLPSHYETFSIVALEAMGCGLPVIAYDLPAFRDVYQKGVITVPLGAYNKFADKVLTLLRDDVLYGEVRRDALEIASMYDWNDIAEEFEIALDAWGLPHAH